jgi:3-hydroxyisobutyrate dehydrogenase
VCMGRKLGLSLETMIEALNATTGRNFTTTGMLPAIAQGRQSTKFRLALQVKDAYQAIGMGADEGVAMPTCSLAAGILQIGLNTLGPDAQLEQIIGVVESMAATRLVNAKA